ncbi:IclR family transcriptional regulator [Cupriavidus pinatubonensis]|uniref:HTH-type transcriptional regulator XynR n=1 Tax=Cupriavidus pinatubonensis TaxID=248026 RepID=A0ABM8XHV5_9BURK|nr:IclR family transcriptional regulator [Cupriavidus pinatubonensis]CAG9179745.1 HTH-type transcriptional regulator XynR [Cupriavidus pinatubonensis]
MTDTTNPTRALASQTLFRGLDVVDAVAAGSQTVQDIANRTGLPFSTTHRLASALVQARYLHFEPRRGYRLGPRLLELGFAAYRDSDITRSARAGMEELAEQTRDTIHLAQLDGDEIIYLDKIGGQRPISVNSRIGGRKPVCSTGVGKALILDETEDKWKARYEYDAKRGNVQLPLDRWLAGMRVYAQGGYAFDLEEDAPSICCVAVPIRDASGQTVAAISVTGTTDYTDEAQLRALIPVVRRVAQSISEKIGGRLGTAPKSA